MHLIYSSCNDFFFFFFLLVALIATVGHLNFLLHLVVPTIIQPSANSVISPTLQSNITARNHPELKQKYQHLHPTSSLCPKQNPTHRIQALNHINLRCLHQTTIWHWKTSSPPLNTRSKTCLHLSLNPPTRITCQSLPITTLKPPNHIHLHAYLHQNYEIRTHVNHSASLSTKLSAFVHLTICKTRSA